MTTHKHINVICCVVLTVTVLITFLLMGVAGSVSKASGLTMGYESKLFDTSVVHIIDIHMDNWDEFLANCKSEEYYICDLVIDGESYPNVAIRGKGNTSLTQVDSYGNDRYSFKVEFDHYDNALTYHGLDKLCLNNLIQDNTYMKDYLTYQMMNEMGVASPLCSYTYITVNGEDWGLYLAVEGVEESFLRRNYGNNFGDLYKPDSMNMGGGRGNGKGFNMDDFDWENFDPNDLGGDFQMPDFSGDIFDFSDEMPDFGGGMFDFGGDFDGGFGGEMPDFSGGFGGFGDEQMPDFSEGFGGGQMQPPGDFDGGFGDEQMPDFSEGFGGGFGGEQMPDFSEGFGGFGDMPQQPGGNMSPGGNGDWSQEMPGKDGNLSSNDKGKDNRFGDFGGGGFGGFGGFGSSDVLLQYTDEDFDSYRNIFDSAKTPVTDADKKRLISALENLSEGENLSETVDVDAVIRYFVVHNFVVNFDSYTGSMIHNYYLYEKDGQLQMLPWDYNLAFGTFQGGDNATSMVNFPIDSPVSGGNAEDRPMIAWIFAEEEYTEAYHAVFAEFVEKYFTDGELAKLIDDTANLIAPYVQKDPTAFCTYEEFETGVAVLREFCLLRGESVQAQLEGTLGSTSQTQKDSDLINADHLNLSDMGSMGGGFGGGRGDFDGGRGGFGGNPDDFGGDWGGFGGNPGDFGSDSDGGQVPDFGGNMPDFGGGMPDFGGDMPDFGGDMPDFGGDMPDFGGDMPNFGGDMPGFEGGQTPPGFEGGQMPDSEDERDEQTPDFGNV